MLLGKSIRLENGDQSAAGSWMPLEVARDPQYPGAYHSRPKQDTYRCDDGMHVHSFLKISCMVLTIMCPFPLITTAPLVIILHESAC